MKKQIYRNKQLKTVTIGIPAHNEEKNIVSLLRSILAQKSENYEIEKIIVVCDGCTDGTERVVAGFAQDYKNIQLINDGRRLGKNARLNQFYRKLTSDIFVSFDGDIRLSNKNVISQIVHAFENKNVGLVGGRVIHRSQKTLIGKIVIVYENFWSRVVDSIQNGNNVHSHTGPISAGRREFLNKVQIPKFLPDDHFLYFRAIEYGYHYVCAKKACVYVNVPATFTDYMTQRTRYIDSGQDIKSYFGEWIRKHYVIAYPIKIRAYFLTFLKYPFYLPAAIVLVVLQRILARHYLENNKNGFWTEIASSKL